MYLCKTLCISMFLSSVMALAVYYTRKTNRLLLDMAIIGLHHPAF